MASFKGFVDGIVGVASEAGSHLLDPSGRKRGTVAYEELMNSMQPALAKEVLDYERNTRFWVEHDAMLKRTKRNSTDWKKAKLENELLILKDFYKDTDYTFDIAAEKAKLENSPQWQSRMAQYEDLMNKGKQYEIKIEDLKTEKGRELNRAKHIGPIQARMEALAREIYKNYGLKGDVKAILGNMGIGKGDQRSLTEAPLGNSNFNVLLPEAADPIELKRLNSIVKAIEGEGINNLDLINMRAFQEGITVDPALTLRDPINTSKLLINQRMETVINGQFNVQSGAKDSSFKQPKSDSEKINIEGELHSPAELVYALYNQSTAGLSGEQGGNAYADLKSDYQQIAALIVNVGTSEDYKINIVDNYTKISMTAFDILKDRITQNKIDSIDPLDYVRGSNRLMYTPLDNNEKLNLIAMMPKILESLGGNKATIAAAVPELKKAMKQSLEVTNLRIVQDTVKAINEGSRFTSQSDAIDMINYINNPESEFTELTESEREYLSEEVTNKFKSERDPFFVPTKELGSDFYSKKLQEDIDSGEFNNITQEVGLIPEEEGDTLLEGFLKKDFSEVPNFSMKNPKHKAAFNAGEIVFVLPSLIGNDILTANQYLDASEDVKKAGKFLKRKAKSLLSKAGDVFENVRDPYMIMEDTSLEFKKEDKIENTIDIIDKLKDELRYLEGDRKNKGKPVLKAYKLKGEDYYTIGFGHYGPDVTEDMEITVEKAEELLEEDILERIPQIQADFKDFEKFKNYLKIPMFIEYYRGSLTASGSPETTRLINEGKYEEAAIEFLDNEEYINAEKLNRRGIRKRMQAVVRALKYYSLNN